MDISSKWTSLEARGMLIHLLSHMPIFAYSTSAGNSHSAWQVGCKASRSKFDLGFVLDLLHIDDHEFRRQVAARLAKSEDPTSGILNSAQVKDLVLDNMVITLGAKKTVNWLSTIARRLLRPLPLKSIDCANPCISASAHV